MSDFKKVFLAKDTTIRFTPFSQNRLYGFTCENFENDSLISSIHYEVKMVCIQSYEDNSFSYEINRKQVYIDNTAPDLKIEQIADSCAQAIFPIQIKVSEEGEIIEVINHNDIKKRWPAIKDKLSKYYQGNIVSEILDSVESTLSNKTILEESICKTWFFHLYFRPIYNKYIKNESLQYTWESPVFGHQIINYDIQQSIEEYYSATDKLFINIKGKSIDKRSINEVLNGYSYPKSEMNGIKIQPLESEMEVQYKLYGEDRSIFSIIGTYKTKITEKKQRTTQIEIYHLPENSSFRPSSQPKQNNFSFWIEEERPKKKKAGFWSKLF
ncbi:hypothetical protein [Flavobacterium hydrophilum]|uniref:Uncharacterized protein n=1 Tax=Flavobacterium hydrophilum TaxID=2211445 RepID=A0A2V4BX37_9FLAO|nr:hypothetical protein [Flavobacterium hydrophilum]PXY43556.1 hypothetical protein DMB68_18370 [Flavobacterium hydrophilum]